jgi:thioredoxin 2
MSNYSVTCSSCGAVNKVPVDKQGISGRCGVCHNALLPLYVQPQTLNQSTFDDFIKSYRGPVLAEFWAPW